MGKILEFNNFRRGKRMFIGDILDKRMKALNISIEALADDTFLDENYIQEIIEDKVSLEEIDPIDIEFISRVLFCKHDYFTSEDVRNRDIIHASMNRGINESSTNVVKGKLQRFANDFVFLKSVLAEVKGGI